MIEDLMATFAMMPPANNNGDSGSGSVLPSFIIFSAIILIIYFLVVKPLQKHFNDNKERTERNHNSDRIISSTGILGMDKRKIILICSIAGIICFFLPFFSIGIAFFKLGISGWDILKGLLELITASGGKGSGFFDNMLKDMTGNFSGLYLAVGIFILSGPIVFVVMFSLMLYKLRTNKPVDFSYLYPVLYTIVSFITLTILGSELKQGLLFFQVMGYGYWITMASFIIAVKYSGGVNIEGGGSASANDSADVYSSIKNFFDVSNTNTQSRQQNTNAPNSDFTAAVAERILHHIKNTTIVHRDTKTTASAFLDTLFKVVTSDTEMAPFTKNYTNNEVKSNLSNILLLCNKRKYSEALAEVTKYIKPLLNRKAPDIEPKAKADNSAAPAHEFRFSFSDDIDKTETKPQRYSYYCPECGTGMENKDNFCPECGHRKVK